MAIKLKAKETLQRIGDYKNQYRYVMGTEIYNRLSEDKVIKEAAIRSGMSRGVMQAAWDAAGEVIKAWATEGHSVAIPGLGTMRFGVRAKSAPSDDKRTSECSPVEASEALAMMGQHRCQPALPMDK